MTFVPMKEWPHWKVVPKGDATGRILEISTKSGANLGCQLSAMRLLAAGAYATPVETIYQASKDFGEGPSVEIGQAPNGFEAKALAKRRAVGRQLEGFHVNARDWPMSTGTAAYDWLWCSAALAHMGDGALSALSAWDGFSDMFWRRGTMTACQARSAAILVSLLKSRNDSFPEEMQDPETWLRWRLGPGVRVPARCRVESKANYRMEHGDVYIGRPQKWGNPYRIGRDGDRASVIRKYRGYLMRQLRDRKFTLNALAAMMGKTLVCWCAPLACHGHVLAEVIAWAYRGGLVDDAWWMKARIDEEGRLEPPAHAG